MQLTKFKELTRGRAFHNRRHEIVCVGTTYTEKGKKVSVWEARIDGLAVMQHLGSRATMSVANLEILLKGIELEKGKLVWKETDFWKED